MSLQALWRHPEFRAGIRDGAHIAPGLAAWGLMTGVAMMKSGLSVIEVVAMGLFVYAGSSQLAALPLLMAGAPVWVVLATTCCVNLRFMVFSVHLRAYLMHQPLWRRLLSGYLTTDMTYVLFTKRFAHPAADADGQRAEEAWLAGNCGLTWVSWMLASFIGMALANAIPEAWGLGFAGILALLGITSSLASTRLRVVAAAVAGAAAVAAYALPLKLNILAGIAAAVFVCLLLDKTQRLHAQRAKARAAP